MKKIFLCFLISLTFFIYGCEDKKSAEQVNTAEWYGENKAARLAMIEKCNADPGQISATPNCVNAKHAQASIDVKKRELPGGEPMTFPKK